MHNLGEELLAISPVRRCMSGLGVGRHARCDVSDSYLDSAVRQLTALGGTRSLTFVQSYHERRPWYKRLLSSSVT
jgi:hypothetical protein